MRVSALLDFIRHPLSLISILIISLLGVAFTVKSISASSSTVNDFLPSADFGAASNSSRYPSGYLGFYDVMDDDSDGTYVKSNSSTSSSGSFGISYKCPSVCPAGVVTSVKVKLRNARNTSAGTNARMGIELRRTDGSIIGSVTGIPFSGTAPSIGTYETVIAVDPSFNLTPSELVTVISWSKASTSGSEVRFPRARLDVTVSDDTVTGDTTLPSVLITNPANGSVFTTEGDMVIQAEANDNIAIQRVEFLKDNILQATDYQTTNPHIFSWHFTSVDNGFHTLSVRVFDTASPQLSSEASISVGINIDPTVLSTPTPTLTPTSIPTQTPVPTIAQETYNVSGIVFLDTVIENGAIDPGESGYSGAAVSSIGVTSASATTNATGDYSLVNLAGGTYNITLIVPFGYTTTTVNPVSRILPPSSVANFGIKPVPTSTPAPTPTPAPAGSKIPLIDMGTQTYLGFSGGLYPNASNTMPIEHSNQGLVTGARVQPLDTNGIPSATGKIVLLSVGMSNTRNEWCKYSDGSSTCSAESFMVKASLDPMVDKQNLLIVNGAKGGEVASSWTSSNSDNYTRIRNDLATLGASEKQVQVIWLKQANKNPTKSLPASDADAYTLETHLGNIIRTLRVRYPNLQQVFISSRIYAGYATTTLNPEPYAYEYGFSVKWLIEAQINQMKNGTIDSRAGNLNYDSGVAPWIAWAPYIWADGTNPRSDGLVWIKSDFKSDGVHPYKTGVPKVSNALLNFFKTNPATSTWFLADGL